jgi:hypothetical protein
MTFERKGFEMKKIVLLISSMMIISCGGGGGGSTPTGPTGHTVSFSAASPSVSSNYVKMEQSSVSGDMVIIAVKAVSIAEPVGGMAIYVTYDNRYLEFVLASNGDVVTGSAYGFDADDDGSGTVVISVSDVTDAFPVSGGTLFNITFKGTATGNGSIGLTNSSLFNAGGSAISVNWYGGTATVE